MIISHAKTTIAPKQLQNVLHSGIWWSNIMIFQYYNRLKINRHSIEKIVCNRRIVCNTNKKTTKTTTNKIQYFINNNLFLKSFIMY